METMNNYPETVKFFEEELSKQKKIYIDELLFKVKFKRKEYYNKLLNKAVEDFKNIPEGFVLYEDDIVKILKEVNEPGHTILSFYSKKEKGFRITTKNYSILSIQLNVLDKLFENKKFKFKRNINEFESHIKYYNLNITKNDYKIYYKETESYRCYSMSVGTRIWIGFDNNKEFDKKLDEKHSEYLSVTDKFNIDFSENKFIMTPVKFQEFYNMMNYTFTEKLKEFENLEV